MCTMRFQTFFQRNKRTKPYTCNLMPANPNRWNTHLKLNKSLTYLFENRRPLPSLSLSLSLSLALKRPDTTEAINNFIPQKYFVLTTTSVPTPPKKINSKLEPEKPSLQSHPQISAMKKARQEISLRPRRYNNHQVMQ